MLKTSVIVENMPINWYACVEMLKEQHICEACTNILVRGGIISKQCSSGGFNFCTINPELFNEQVSIDIKLMDDEKYRANS